VGELALADSLGDGLERQIRQVIMRCIFGHGERRMPKPDAPLAASWGFTTNLVR
jgi:hypothetical protein